MTTIATVRRIALALPEVTEGLSFGTPSFHVRRKLVARLRDDGETLVVKVDLADRPRYLERWPDTFYLTEHYLKYSNMLVYLTSINEDSLREVIEGAWRLVAPKRLVQKPLSS